VLRTRNALDGLGFSSDHLRCFKLAPVYFVCPYPIDLNQKTLVELRKWILRIISILPPLQPPIASFPSNHLGGSVACELNPGPTDWKQRVVFFGTRGTRGTLVTKPRDC